MPDCYVIPVEQLLRREGKCPLSFSDEKGKKKCVVEGKIRGIDPLTGNDPVYYTGCGGGILECPYDSARIEAALTEQINYLDKILKTKREDLENIRGHIRQKRFQI